MSPEGGVRRGLLPLALRVREPAALRYVIPLPGARPPLSLNDRGHWRPKAKRAAGLRETVAWHARALRIPTGVDRIMVALYYVPADRRTRDADNLVATLKPCIDALTAKGLARGWPCHPVIADDDPGSVTWAPPIILEPDGRPRYWLEVTIPTPVMTDSTPGGDTHVVQGR